MTFSQLLRGLPQPPADPPSAPAPRWSWSPSQAAGATSALDRAVLLKPGGFTNT